MALGVEPRRLLIFNNQNICVEPRRVSLPAYTARRVRRPLAVDRVTIDLEEAQQNKCELMPSTLCIHMRATQSSLPPTAEDQENPPDAVQMSMIKNRTFEIQMIPETSNRKATSSVASFNIFSQRRDFPRNRNSNLSLKETSPTQAMVEWKPGERQSSEKKPCG